MIQRIEAWVMARILAGESVNSEREALSRPLRRLVDHLTIRPPEDRQEAWEGFLCSTEDREEIILAIAAADPLGPPPFIEPARFATPADVRRMLTQTRWSWEGWIPSASIVGIGAAEGTGKTRLALDLCRRIYLGEPWPDGQSPTLPIGTRSIWMCADAHQDELAELLPAFGITDDAIVFPTSPEEPYGGTDLDDPETLAALEAAVIAVKPGLIFVDTLTSATSRDLCDQRTMKPLKASLAHLAQTYGVSIVLQLHLSREGQALGRRIRGITRTLLHLECPDPDRSERLRLWVEKSYAKKPPPMGVTMGASRNTYDFEPPKTPPKNSGGRPPESREKAAQFIRDELTKTNDLKATSLCATWEGRGGNKHAFWRARDAMVEADELVCEGKPLILHLIRTEAHSGEAKPVPDGAVDPVSNPPDPWVVKF